MVRTHHSRDWHRCHTNSKCQSNIFFWNNRKNFLWIKISCFVYIKKKSRKNDSHESALIGLFCIILACILSGVAGVYFEKILKNSKASIWVQNIQLGASGTFFALASVWYMDYDNVSNFGFFFGYNNLVWGTVFFQSAGGLLVAVVIKYADNILKGFASSISIIVSVLASAYLFDTKINDLFVLGTCLVVTSVFLYSYTPTSTHTLNDPAKSPNLSYSRRGVEIEVTNPKNCVIKMDQDTEHVSVELDQD
jgi:UDP-galactose transporter